MRRKTQRDSFTLVHRKNGGQSIPLIALIVVVLFGMVGLAVDVGNTHAEQRKAVSAANAASIAGMNTYIQGGDTVTDADIATAVQQSLEVNDINACRKGSGCPDGGDVRTWQSDYLDAEGNVIGSVGEGVLPDGVSYIQVNLDGTVDTFFARVVNRNTLPVDTLAIAAQCPLGSGVYPIAVNKETIDGENFIDPDPEGLADPPQWGIDEGYTWRRLYMDTNAATSDYGWLRWPANSTDTSLREMLSGDGNLLQGFQEADWPDGVEVSGVTKPDVYPEKPGQINSHEWVYGSDDNLNAGVRTVLNGHRDNLTVMVLPIYSEALGSGGGATYFIQEFGTFLLRDYGEENLGGGIQVPYIEILYTGAVEHTSACTTDTTFPDTLSLTGKVQFKPVYATADVDRRPIRYMVVLDVSGSMNFSFDGRGEKGGTEYQCGNAPGVEYWERDKCNEPHQHAWDPVEERRIYVAREAIVHLINSINIPDNTDIYQSDLPSDQMAFVTFASQMTNSSDWSNDKNTLENRARTIGEKGNYTTSGGTNGAAGLYGAAKLLEGDNTVTFGGTNYEYKTVVIFVTDGVSNHMYDPNRSDTGYLYKGNNNYMGFPTDNPCNFLADDDLETDENGDPIPRMHIPEAVMCHVNATAGGPYVETGPPPHRTPTGRTFDRPITAMIQVSQDFLHGSHTVYVVALSDIPATGLRDGVASQTDYYKTAENLSEEDSEGRNNVDLIFEQIKEDVEYGPCQPQKEAAFVGDPSQVTSPYDDGVFGYAYLRHEDGDITTPIKLNDDGFLEYTFNDVTEGNYTFEAYVQYYHPDDIMTEEPRQYSRIWNGTDAEDSMSILMRPSLDNLSGVTENDIQLVFDGSDACSD